MKSVLAAAAGLAVGIGAMAYGQPPAGAGEGSKQNAVTPPPPMPPQPDLSKTPTLYVVGYAHLDTQWRWTYPQTIREFVKATLDDNFKLFEKYPSYVFNFSGSRRYQFMQEYYPELYERLKKEVAAGKWFPCGSSVDENDANVPSAESIIRHVLYGNRFFRREFGVASEEYMLPDCFGFPFALPSVLAHCGIKGFSTQKLTWNAVVPIPFKVGVWQGPDGHGVIAALDPGNYVGEVMEDLSKSNGWQQRIEANGKKSGVYTDYHYYGTGDRGGAPTERSVANVEKSVHSDGPIKVISGPADWMFKTITPSEREHLPEYKGELLLTEHSAGSVTSEAYMKRWNRKNELLADSAERASVAAWWLGGRPYPSKTLEDAWTLVLGSQMHDILPGTSHPYAYNHSWNDELIAANQFQAALMDGAGVVVSQMDTQSKYNSVVVYNPLSVEREDIVEAEVPDLTKDRPRSVVVTGPDGKRVPAQVLGPPENGKVKVAFLARVPSVGFAAFDVGASSGQDETESTLKVSERQLENERYTVKLDDNGDVSSIFDKQAKRELLASPARLEQHYENPRDYPAWNQDWADRQLPTKETVHGPAEFRIIENGPARVAVEVTRHEGASIFHQTIRLAAGGAENRVEFDTFIDWNARERSLRAAFPLTVSNPMATYDIQTGVIERGNNAPKRYEAPSHQWFDLTDAKGDYGVTVMNDSKFGSDKPADNEVRLTLLYTPGTRAGFQDQGTQDVGRHHILYAVEGHEGDWRAGKSAVEAARVNQPLMAFIAHPHEGSLGKSFSLLRVSDDGVRVSALKKAEDGNEVIIRLRELSGSEKKGVRIAMARPIVSAREVDGQEREIGPASVQNGELVTNISAYELRAYALRLSPPPVFQGIALRSEPVKLVYDTDAISRRANRADGSMDGKGDAYPAEQLPHVVVDQGVEFRMGPSDDGAKNAVVCNGQEIAIPGGTQRVEILAASSDGDVALPVGVGGQDVTVQFRNWNGVIGQWDRRLWLGEVPEQTFGWNNELGGIEPGYVHPEEVGWFVSHFNTPRGDAYYDYCYLFKHDIAVPAGATSIRLPKDPRVKVFAATAIMGGDEPVTPAAPLFDTLSKHQQDAPIVEPASGTFSDATEVRVLPRLYFRPGAIRYTLDGTEPTARSPEYKGPIVLSQTATVRAAVLDGRGRLGPATTAKIEVNDTTPPRVVSVQGMYHSPHVKLRFSEPVAGPLGPSNFVMQPGVPVQGVALSPDGREADVMLAQAPEVGAAYRVVVMDVKDRSPAHNTIQPDAKELKVPGPVFRLAEVTPDQMGKRLTNVKDLPVKAGDAWTINMFVKTDKQPANRTLIAGFGKAEQSQEGGARYLAKFGSGVHFWSHNRDLATRTPLDLNAWQMLTATYDGKTLRLYKDGKPIGEQETALADDEPVVNIAPLDPWDGKRQFEGQIREFTIWGGALGEDAIRSLRADASLP